MSTRRDLILGLPGRNSETYRWMSKLLDVALPYMEHRVARYRHWQCAGEYGDVAHEARSITINRPAAVVAKSFGTLVLLQAYEQLGFRPSHAVLIGYPLRHAVESQRQALVSFVREVPTLAIQQSEDFTGSFAELNALVAGRARTIEVPGSDHEYQDVDQLAGWIRKFVKA